jgi:bifunctional DNase/RNase
LFSNPTTGNQVRIVADGMGKKIAQLRILDVMGSTVYATLVVDNETFAVVVDTAQ